MSVLLTGFPFSLLVELFLACFGGGFTPLTSIISPVFPRGLGGGGCLLGSVGLSEETTRGIFLGGGGVVGLGTRLCGTGDGDGGLTGLDRCLGSGGALVWCSLVLDLWTDLDLIDKYVHVMGIYKNGCYYFFLQPNKWKNQSILRKIMMELIL